MRFAEILHTRQVEGKWYVFCGEQAVTKGFDTEAEAIKAYMYGFRG